MNTVMEMHINITYQNCNHINHEEDMLPVTTLSLRPTVTAAVKLEITYQPLRYGMI